MYDVNPIPYGEELSLNVNEYDNTISVELALETAIQYGIGKEEAEKMAGDILSTVRENLEKFAASYGLNRSAVEYMRPAF